MTSSWIVHISPTFYDKCPHEGHRGEKSGEGQVKTVAETEVMQLTGPLEPTEEGQTRKGSPLEPPGSAARLTPCFQMPGPQDNEEINAVV